MCFCVYFCVCYKPVTITSKEKKSACVMLSDRGGRRTHRRGIPEEILPCMTSPGASEGKEAQHEAAAVGTKLAPETEN